MKRIYRTDIRARLMRAIAALLVMSFVLSWASPVVVLAEETEGTDEATVTVETTETAETEETSETTQTEPTEETTVTETQAETEPSETENQTEVPATSEEPTETTTYTESTPEEYAVNTVNYEATTESGIVVKAETTEGAFTEDVAMTATDIAYDEVIDDVSGTLGEETEIKGLVAVDITFTDENGNELEPAEGSFVNVTITLPEDAALEGEDYALIHVDDEGGAEEICGADITSTEAEFYTDSFSIYVVTSVGDRDKDQIRAWISAAGGTPNQYGYISNTQNTPYLLLNGESITLIGKVDQPIQNLRFDYWDSNGYWGSQFREMVDITPISSSTTEVSATITAKKTGTLCIVLTGDGGFEEQFHIKIYEPEERNTVTINMNDSQYTYDGNPNNIPIVDVDFHDTIVFSGTPNSYEEGYDWPYIDGNENPGGNILTWTGISEENGIRSRICEANTYDRDNNIQIVSFYAENGVMKKVKIRVNNRDSDRLDHADIEIADGGIYTDVSFVIGDDGGMIKTTTQYQAYVSSVNKCELLKDDGTSVYFFQRTEDQSWATITDVPAANQYFGSNDYWTDPEEPYGSSQYELTSKYYKLDTDGDGTYDTGTIPFGKCFFLYEVNSAVFDININVVPLKIEKEKWDPATQTWVKLTDQTEEYTISDDFQTYTKKVGGVEVALSDDEKKISVITTNVENVIYNLDKQAVLDAYNKCPNQTGLDFTIHANSAMVEFEATKELTNGVLKEGDFTFELVVADENYQPVLDSNGDEIIEWVTNNANGKAKFRTKVYDKAGTYYYIIRERDESATRPDIIFSNAEYHVKVEVTEIPGSGGMLMANVVEQNNNYNFKFINEVKKYMLPDTGGGGVIPLYLTGAALMAAPLLLYSTKKGFYNKNINKSKKGTNMKKTLKRLASVLTSCLVVMSLFATVMAATEVTIKITKPDTDKATHTYSAYQIFTGDRYEDPATGAIGLQNISFGTGIDQDALKTALGLPATATAQDCATEIEATYLNNGATLADLLQNNGVLTTASATAEIGPAVTTAELKVSGPGYYFILDKLSNPADAQYGAVSDFMLKVLEEVTPVTITAKADVPELNKVIDDGTTAGTNANTASIGDLVPFKLTSKVPDMQGYNQYYFVVNDTLCKGLTYNSSTADLTVKVGTKTLVKDTDYTLGVSVAATGETTLKIVFKNFIQYTQGQPIVITYKAELNANCDRTELGNENTANLVFSNDPNYNYTGTDEPGPGEPTGETPDVVTKTYTTDIKIIKVDRNGAALNGAQFSLTGNGMNKTLVCYGEYTESSTGTYYKLKDGTYTTTVPTTGTESRYDSTTKKYVYTDVIEEQTAANTTTVTGFVDNNGYFIVEGLSDGEYTITETKAPAGYQGLSAPIKFTIKSDPSLTTPNWMVDTSAENSAQASYNATTHQFEVTVENAAGTKLPSTGGIGTYIFYAAGVVLLVGGAVVLIRKKKTQKD